MKFGFRATVEGKISKLGDKGTPPTLTNASFSFGDCAVPFVPPQVEDGSFRTFYFIHGALMMTSWGLLLPTGVIWARFSKHLPDALWFKVHRVTQPVGIILATVGWIVALVTFDVFSAGVSPSFLHGTIGSIVMVLGILQPFNAFIRPHAEPPSTGRKVWEIVHKGSGWFAVIFGLIVVALGTLVIPLGQLNFQLAYAAILVWLVGLLVFLINGRKKAEAEQKEGEGTELATAS